MKSQNARNVLDLYLFAVRLKNIIRTGWKQWNVPRERLESVAEHVFSTQMLAISIWSEYSYEINIYKVSLMLAIHELEEIKIGDITPYQGISREEKMHMGHEAVQKILSSLLMKKEYYRIIEEFDEGKTPEASFAYMCDKLDADLMSIIYDINGECTLEKSETSLAKTSSLIAIKKSVGARSMSDFFYQVDKSKYDEHFMEVLEAMYNGEYSKEHEEYIENNAKEEASAYESVRKAFIREICEIAEKLE